MAGRNTMIPNRTATVISIAVFTNQSSFIAPHSSAGRANDYSGKEARRAPSEFCRKFSTYQRKPHLSGKVVAGKPRSSRTGQASSGATVAAFQPRRNFLRYPVRGHFLAWRRFPGRRIVRTASKGKSASIARVFALATEADPFTPRKRRVALRILVWAGRRASKGPAPALISPRKQELQHRSNPRRPGVLVMFAPFDFPVFEVLSRFPPLSEQQPLQGTRVG